MNNEAWMVLAQNIPAAIAVIITVSLFLQDAKQARKALADSNVAFQVRLIAAAKDCHDTQDRSIEALLLNAKASSKQAHALGVNSQSLQGLILQIAKCEGMK